MAGWRACVFLAIAAGCHHTSATVAPRPAMPTVAPVTIELPLTKPTIPVLDGKDVPALPVRTSVGLQGETFRQLTERDCLLLAAVNASAANTLDDENRVPPASGTNSARDQLRRTMRYHAALELRNLAAADALERFIQLSDVEARTELLRDGFPVVDAQLDRAKKAKTADVRFPLDIGDLTRQRSQLVTDLEQAEQGTRLLNLDLKRRLALPYQPASERLWPVGDFAINPTTPDVEQAVNAALADRPELRGLRALYHGLTPETLPDARDYLRAANSLTGQRLPHVIRRMFAKNAGPDAATLAELEVRRKQILDLIADRERAVADEARAAILTMNAQVSRIAHARERQQVWEEKLADAVKKRAADQPGAELLESQMRTELLKTKAEVVTEVAAWHQARVKLKAAQGWLAWEAAPEKK
ncbi:MAG: hypothetical protein C0467_01695 [Planctomycetaceae bacterium]|nr:hypothetical protein [Planctomycetaceae bacterium]